MTSIWPAPPATVGRGGGLRGRFGSSFGVCGSSGIIDMGDLYIEIPLTALDLLESSPTVKADAIEEMASRAKI